MSFATRIETATRVREAGQAIFADMVYKLAASPGSGPPLSIDSEVQLAMRIFVDPRQPGDGAEPVNEARDPECLEFHSVGRPLVKRLPEILPLGLQMAVKTMCAGECAWIWIHPLLAFGPEGFEFGDRTAPAAGRIRPNAAMLYEVCLVRFIPLELSSSTSAGRPARRLRFENMPVVDGVMSVVDEQLGRGDHRGALHQLRNAITLLEQMRIDAERERDHERQREEALLTARRLAAVSAFALAKYPLTITLGKHVLETDPTDAETRFIVGRAHLALGNYASAAYHVRRAQALDPRQPHYEAKLDEIDRHRELLFDDGDDSDDDKDAAEIRAELQVAKRAQCHRQVIKDVQKELNSIFEHDRQAVISGGFSKAELEKIRDKLRPFENQMIVKSLPDSIEVHLT